MASRLAGLAVATTIAFTCVLSLAEASQAYDREDAKDYAQSYALSPNTNWPYFTGEDCANFVSQSIHAGNVGMDNTWYMRWVISIHPYWEYGTAWTVAPTLHSYFKDSTRTSIFRTLVGTYDFDPDSSRPRPERCNQDGMVTGDIISYDWDLYGGSTWTVDHVAICTGLNAHSTYDYDWQGDLRCQHSNNRYREAWQCGDRMTSSQMAAWGFAVWRISTALT